MHRKRHQMRRETARARSGIDLIFVDARVKINDAYYHEVLLTQKLLPVMREICGELNFSSSKAMFLLTERVGQSAF